MATAINGQNYEPFNSAAFTSESPIAGVYYAIPPIAEPPRESAPSYDEIPVTYPGVDGIGMKRMGFRGRDIAINLVIAGATKTAVETAKNSLFSNITGLARFSVTVEGGTARPGCKLVKDAGVPVKWFTIGTAICCLVSLMFRQLSEDN